MRMGPGSKLFWKIFQNPNSVKVTGKVHFLLKGKDGTVKIDEWHDNLTVAVGRNHIADQLAEQDEAAMSHMAVGTGTTDAEPTDTALEAEIDRNALTSKVQGTGSDSHKVTHTCVWAPGDGTGPITEAGIFNSNAAGVMFCRSVFPVKNKGAADSLTMTWVLTLSA